MADLKAALGALSADVSRAAAGASGQDRDRAAHLTRQVDALLLVARRLLGESPSFDEEARLGLGLAPVPLDAAAIERARTALDREVPGQGPLADRVAGFRRRFAVPDDAREAVMRAALDQCRAATREALPLPDSESIAVAFVDGLPWDAYARYLGAHRTRIDINGSEPLDLARALRLACHEGYAGHHAQYIWLDDEVIGRRRWTEFALVPGFGPDLLVSEGTAEAGAALAMPAARRLAVYREHLAPVAGLETTDLDRLVRVEELLAAIEPIIGDIAREYLDNHINTAGAVRRLADEALVVDAESFVTFIERRRTRLLAYAEGRRRALARGDGSGLASLRSLLVTGLGPP
ncbi:MAG: hypothetical protein OEW19_12215 [Acidobacteriota bacterium]|nr:hypothetical protein [Acidobacteriota bacterium]